MSGGVLLTGSTSAIGKEVHAILASKGINVIRCHSSASEDGRAYFNLLTGENNLGFFKFDRIIHLAWDMRDRSEMRQVNCQQKTMELIAIARVRKSRFDFLSSVEAEGSASNYALAKLSVEDYLETYPAGSVIRAGIIWGVGYFNPLLNSLSRISNFPGVCPHIVSTRQFFFTNITALAEEIVNCQPSARISSFYFEGYSLLEVCHRLRRKHAFVHLKIPLYPFLGIRKLLSRLGLHYVTLDRIAALADQTNDLFRFRFDDSRKNHGLPHFLHKGS